MSDGFFTMPRASVQYWAGDVQEIAARLGDLQPNVPGAAEAVAEVQRVAIDLLRDMIAHGIQPEAGQRLELMPNAPASALSSLDRLDPLPNGERRVNASTLREMATANVDLDDDDDDLDEVLDADPGLYDLTRQAVEDLPQADFRLPHSEARAVAAGAS